MKKGDWRKGEDKTFISPIGYYLDVSYIKNNHRTTQQLAVGVRIIQGAYKIQIGFDKKIKTF